MVPGFEIQTDDDIAEWGTKNFFASSHYVGTCKMGNDISRDDIVVDNRLKVKGIDNLRVVDK